MQHGLWPLIKPRSVAVIGATEREHALGRALYGKLRAGAFRGDLYAVNSGRTTVMGDRAWRSLAAIGTPVDLAVIATPAHAVPRLLAEAPEGAMRAALLLTGAPDGSVSAMRAWNDGIVALARQRGIRLLGPRAHGLVRTDIGLDASVSAVQALPGRLAVIAQSGAVCTALLDFATPLGIGFSSVVAVGEARDVDVPELLDALVLDGATDAILVHIEDVSSARDFMSALRAAARVKPVVVLKAGRSLEGGGESMQPSPDAVFSAALRRAGTVRVQTYTQLFAAARALAIGRIPRGDGVGIMANGRGPGILAADRAVDVGLRVAPVSPAARASFEQTLPAGTAIANPLDLRGDATAQRYGDSLATMLADPAIDGVIVLHVPRPADPLAAAAAAVAVAAHATSKPVLAAWLGAVDRPEVREAFAASAVANFYTPENAVEAFAFLASYRRNQALLLEVPAWRAEAQAPDLAAAERIRMASATGALTRLDDRQAGALLAAFDVDRRAAEAGCAPVEFAVGLHHDDKFGPVLALGGGARFPFAPLALALPPLNHRLALDLVDGSAARAVLAHGEDGRASLVRLLLQVSALASALPWVRSLRLDPVRIDARGIAVEGVCIDVDAAMVPGVRYAHMAIHPYPEELVADITLHDGTTLHLRPIRPEDAELETHFVAGLSERTRYLRFFRSLHELTPQMLVHFTQVDYDREVALVALAADAAAPGGQGFAGIARYIRNPDRRSAEFAVVVGDAWQRRGLGRVLMAHLMAAARERHIERLEGTVLRGNDAMLRFVAAMGFVQRPGDTSDIVAVEWQSHPPLE